MVVTKVTPYLALLLVLSMAPVQAKVVNSDKNDVSSSTQNETVQVLSIEDLNKTQYLNQNFRQGNYNYGYDVKPEGPNGQFHHENKAPDGVVFGCYGYVDPNDKPQITYYVSDSWGYRPVSVGNSAKVFYPSENSEKSTEEMKGTLRSWSQLEFPTICANYENDGATPLSASGLSLPDRFPIPPEIIRSQTGTSIKTASQITHAALRGEILYPGTGGKPGAPGILSDGGYGGEGGTGGLVSGSAAANGGPGGNGGDGGVSSGSSKANGGNGGSGGHAGVASGSSVANGGQGGHGGDGGKASGSSDASGSNGGVGGKGGSASGSSNASGGAAGVGAKGGVASGSSSAIGGSAGDGGDGGNASGSSAARGGVGGTGGRGGTSSGSSSADGGTAGAGGRGGNASGSSSASAGDGGSAGNGGVASGSSVANGGSGGVGGSGAGAAIAQVTSSEKGGYSYTPPKGYVQRLPLPSTAQTPSSKAEGGYVQRLPSPSSAQTPSSNLGGGYVQRLPSTAQTPSSKLPLPATGGLLAEEQYTEEIRDEQRRPTSLPTTISLGPIGGETTFSATPPTVTRPLSVSGSGIPSSIAESSKTAQMESGYTYPTPQSSQKPGIYQNVSPAPTRHSTGNSQEVLQQEYYQGDKIHTTNANRFPVTPSQRPFPNVQNHGQRPGSQAVKSGPLKHDSQSQRQQGNLGNYFGAGGSGGTKPGGLLNPPAYQTPTGDPFHVSNNYYPHKTPTLGHGGGGGGGSGHVQIPAGIYVPPNESGESGESDQNGLGNDSGSREQSPGGGSDCDQGYGGKCGYPSQSEGIDYAQLPGAITSNVPVIFYPDCRSNAYTRPAIVPFCPSLQQNPASCAHHQPLTMKFPTGGNPYNNVPSSRGAYPSNFPNFGYGKSRHAKRVVRRSRRNQQSRYI